LFFGVAISYAYHFHHARFIAAFTRSGVLVGGGLILIAPAFVFELESTPFIYTAGFTLFYVGAGMLLIAALRRDTPGNRPVRAMASLGAKSYSIYLWHMPVIAWGLPLVERAAGTTLPYGWRIAFCVAASLGVGVAMAAVVEFPVLRLRDRWFPALSRGPIDSPRTDSR
jgi:peptidoglycan/LPS O-acetylase OafA/YrhL